MYNIQFSYEIVREYLARRGRDEFCGLTGLNGRSIRKKKPKKLHPEGQSPLLSTNTDRK